MSTRSAMPLVVLTLLFVPRGTLEARGPAVGYWKATIDYQGGEGRDYYVDLSQKGDKLSGLFISPRSGESAITGGSIDGQNLTFSVERDFGGNTYVFEIAGKVTEGKFKGSVSIGGNEAGDMSMTRLPDPIGTWKARSERPDGGDAYESTLVLERAEKGFKGVIKSGQFEVKIKKAMWKNDDFLISAAFTREDTDIPIEIKARFDSENKLKGKWSVKTANDEEFSGAWSAARKPRTSQFAAFLGRWESTSTLENGREINYALVLKKDGDKLTGKFDGRRGATDLRDLKVQGKKLTFRIDFQRQDNTVRIDFAAELGEDGSLKGKWETENDASGEWKAKKKAEKKTEEKKETRI